jgi:5-methylcytosine-specific restriction endonuclease McrA
MELNTDHWLITKTGPKGKRQDLDAILVKDSTYKYTTALKKRLVRAGLLEYRCYLCGIHEWENKELTLEMDHANGDRNDNRIDNLRLLCPNCHSQTPTHGSKNGRYRINDKLKRAITAGRRKQKYKTNKCVDCQKGISYGATQCKSCYGKDREQTKISWPPVEELFKRVRDEGYSAVARDLGVSDNAVRKRIKNHS